MRDGVLIKPSGSLRADAHKLGYKGDKSGVSFSYRLKTLIKNGDLTEAEIKAQYKEFGREKIDDIPKETIIAFIRGQLELKPSGSLRKDAAKLGYQAHAGFSNRLKALIAEDPSLLPIVESIYQNPRINWRPKAEVSHEILAQAAAEGLPDDEIRSTFNLSAASLRKWQKTRTVDDTRRIPREEFLQAVRGTSSLDMAAAQLGLAEQAVSRRAERYLNIDALELEQTPSIRWAEAQRQETLPAHSPMAVFVCAKQLCARFNSRAKPSITDIADHLKQPREHVERHIELLIRQGLLARDQLAQPELVA
jgi:hypothetical protein